MEEEIQITHNFCKSVAECSPAEAASLLDDFTTAIEQLHQTGYLQLHYIALGLVKGSPQPYSLGLNIIF